MRKLIFYITLLWSCSAVAQSPEQFRAAIKNWHDTNFPIKIGVTLNQPFYAPGDTVFCSILVLNPQLAPVSTTHVVNVRLQNGAGKTILSQQVLARKGAATNALALPDSLRAGLYELIVYNDWMLNFNKQLISRLPLLISTGKIQLPLPGHSLQASIEGGYLVAGVDNKIHVAAKPSAAGLLLQSDQLVQSFTTNEHGDRKSVV